MNSGIVGRRALESRRGPASPSVERRIHPCGRADIEIRARVPGYLLGIHFLEGGTVEKGQLLYSIDQSELLQEVTASEATLAAARTALAYAESDVARYRPLASFSADWQSREPGPLTREHNKRIDEMHEYLFRHLQDQDG